MLIEIPNDLGFACLKLADDFVQIEDAVVQILEEAVAAEEENV